MWQRNVCTALHSTVWFLRSCHKRLILRIQYWTYLAQQVLAQTKSAEAHPLHSLCSCFPLFSWFVLERLLHLQPFYWNQLDFYKVTNTTQAKKFSGTLGGLSNTYFWKICRTKSLCTNPAAPTITTYTVKCSKPIIKYCTTRPRKTEIAHYFFRIPFNTAKLYIYYIYILDRGLEYIYVRTDRQHTLGHPTATHPSVTRPGLNWEMAPTALCTPGVIDDAILW